MDSLPIRVKLSPGPFREQAVEAFLAERGAHRRDHFERQLSVAFRESRCSAFSQPPHADGSANRAALVQARNAEIGARVELARVTGVLTPEWLQRMVAQ